MHMNRVIWQHMSINMCLDHMASVQEEDGSGEQDGNNNEDGGLVMGSKEGGSSTSGIIINIIGGDNRLASRDSQVFHNLCTSYCPRPNKLSYFHFPNLRPLH